MQATRRRGQDRVRIRMVGARSLDSVEEPHLCSRAHFALHVLFDRGEVEIEADELSIQRMSKTL